MWLKWLPWRFVVRRIARQQGFLDPLNILSKFQNFSQPTDVLVPTELLRSGLVLHARGLMNSQAIQHNLDWVWPYWVERQFDPNDPAFIPRAFSITQINLTHRNWTAVGIPDSIDYPIVDPRGLVTPLFDGWSIDAWIINQEQKKSLIPSRQKDTTQSITTSGNIVITTQSSNEHFKLISETQVVGEPKSSFCQIKFKGLSNLSGEKSWLVVSFRPYNPEGVCFIHSAQMLKSSPGWKINNKDIIHFDTQPDHHAFSYYRRGDVYSTLFADTDHAKETYCTVGMATGAALFRLQPNHEKSVILDIPLQAHETNPPSKQYVFLAEKTWKENLSDNCQLNIPDKHFQFLYETAVRTLILHTPKETYPGPYTYRHFWFRDAAFILYAMTTIGLTERAKRTLDCFPKRQNKFGYFLSQDGEWDSNGEALWIFQKFCQLTNTPPSQTWLSSIRKGALWITRKRLSNDSPLAHAGLFPPGFSAEHLGPNDYYYWDDFWGIAGLEAAAYFEKQFGKESFQTHFQKEAIDFRNQVHISLLQVEKRLNEKIMPAAPYRRMDAGAIGSLAAGYPLQIFSKDDPFMLNTVKYLLDNCMVNDGFFHDMTHSGINPYLTLDIAQVLLRAGDSRYYELMKAIADLASPTGQWPEAIHPKTKGGCMGDGQHVWAAAEWILLMRNCFVREEEQEKKLILCSGIPSSWLQEGQKISFGKLLTIFGSLDLTIDVAQGKIQVSWQAQWHHEEPKIEIHFPGRSIQFVNPGQRVVTIT